MATSKVEHRRIDQFFSGPRRSERRAPASFEGVRQCNRRAGGQGRRQAGELRQLHAAPDEPLGSACRLEPGDGKNFDLGATKFAEHRHDGARDYASGIKP